MTARMNRPPAPGPDVEYSLVQMGPLAACALAIVAIGAGVAARLGLDSLFEYRSSFLFFVPAVVLAAALAGLWPGLFATILGAIAGLAIDFASGGIVAGDLIGAGLFLLVGGAVTIGGDWFQRARNRAADVNNDLVSEKRICARSSRRFPTR